MAVDPEASNYREIYKLMIGAIVPRPIAFVSTVNPEGAFNLAPFSFFNGISANPPVICFGSTVRSSGDTCKDTLRNILRTREFVVNIVSEEFAAAMNLCSGEYPPDIDEFKLSGLTAIPSEVVKPPRVKESHVHMECRLYLTVELSQLPGGGSLVLGQVVRFHVDDDYVTNFQIDPDKLRAIGRMGGSSYTRTRDRFDMARPKV